MGHTPHDVLATTEIVPPSLAGHVSQYVVEEAVVVQDATVELGAAEDTEDPSSEKTRWNGARCAHKGH